MDPQELLKKLQAIQAMKQTGAVGTVAPPVQLNQMQALPDVQMQDSPVEDKQIPRTREPSSVSAQPDTDDSAPMTQIDNVEARKAALERLKQRGTQKLNFRGGLLDQNGVYDHDDDN